MLLQEYPSCFLIQNIYSYNRNLPSCKTFPFGSTILFLLKEYCYSFFQEFFFLLYAVILVFLQQEFSFLLQFSEAQKVVEDAAVDHEGEEPVVEVNVKEVTDEFCSNAEFIENILSEENSVSFRMIVKDTDDIQVFKNKVRNSFFTADVDIVHQHFEISGLETLPDQIKFYLKVINDKKAIEAILNLKSDNILLMKIPKKEAQVVDLDH